MPRLKFTYFLIVISIVLFGINPVFAQKVAIVLSGGGAKGLSHVGVLRALEENNIPIDYIAGTSMGAVVGGLYASGYSPAEIETLLTSREFIRWASGELDIKNQFFFKKKPDNPSWISLPIHYDKRFRSKIPLNLVPTDEMDITIMELFAGPSAASKYDFNNLFVPFRCVTTDIEASESVIMKDGQLGEAIRASMSVPFYFSPIRVNGKLLFDGGMYNNFPVDVAYNDFSPDIIIGSKASSNFAPPQEDDIISQLQNMLMSKTDYSNIPGKGIIIEPDLGSMNLTDFSRAKEYIDSGYIHTMNKIDTIKSLVSRKSDPKELFQKRLNFHNKIPPIAIESIQIEGCNIYQSTFVNRHIKRKQKYLNMNDLKWEYYKLLADNNITSIYPALLYDSVSSSYHLNFQVKKASDFMADFGGNISSKSVNEAYIGLQYNHFGITSSNYNMGLYFGRFYSGLRLNARIDYPSRLPYYLQASYVLHYRDYFKNTTYFVEDKTPSYLLKSEYYGEVEFGIPITNRSRLSSGLTTGKLADDYYQTNYFLRSDTTDRTSFLFTSPFMRFEYNTLNRKQYPTTGAKHYLSLQYVIGEEKHVPGSTSQARHLYSGLHQYWQFRAISESYFNALADIKTGIYAELYFSNKKFFNNYTATILMAQQFQPTLESSTMFLPGYRAHNYIALGVKEIFSITKSLDFRTELYFFQPFKQIFADPESLLAYYGDEFKNNSYIASASLVYQTRIGPMSLALNYYEKRKDSFSVMFNIGFILFNKFGLE
ncbi:MAG: patatin-like phospholipase family protein [Bacteroidetes bacterium]|nr:patatin-like phospholipase family protein [Bacteroidota bacterium]